MDASEKAVSAAYLPPDLAALVTWLHKFAERATDTIVWERLTRAANELTRLHAAAYLPPAWWRANTHFTAARDVDGEVVGVSVTILVTPERIEHLPIELRVLAERVYARAALAQEDR